jgi:biotin-(acetyl-CoA carboxylase) ligase
VVLSAASLPSTQTLLHLNSAAVPDDTLCVADQQKAGKGESIETVFRTASLLHVAVCEVVRCSHADALPRLRMTVRGLWFSSSIRPACEQAEEATAGSRQPAA